MGHIVIATHFGPIGGMLVLALRNTPYRGFAVGAGPETFKGWGTLTTGSPRVGGTLKS